LQEVEMDNPQIVVGVDGSHGARQALRWAAAEAQRRNVGLLIAYSGDAESKPGSDAEEPGLVGRSVLADSAALVFEDGFDCDVRTVSCYQPAVPFLLELGRQADLVVVGTHGSASDTGGSLGSVAYRVAAHASCPVAVVGQLPQQEPAATSVGADSMKRSQVSVGVTASPHGLPALEVAFAEAALRNLTLNAVHSWAEFNRAELAGTTDLYLDADEFRRRQEGRFGSLLAPLRERYSQVTVRPALTDAPVWVSLAEASAESSLLVLGCRHRNSHLVSRLGPTTTRLIHVAKCPVVVVGHQAVRATAASPLMTSAT
jgi:nucleotide-binding universal stress UspA family protein